MNHESLFTEEAKSEKSMGVSLDKITLLSLAERMHQIENFPSNLGAGYTYLGQFIDHDITFTPNSDRLAKESDTGNTKNQVSEALDLSSVYVEGGLEKQPAVCLETGKMLLGDTIGAPTHQLGLNQDLPRDPQTKKALIPDQRNDENLMIAQLHVQFLRFHNYLIDKISKQEPDWGSRILFKNAKKELIKIYRKIVIEDYLFNVLHPEIYKLYFGSAGNSSRSFREKNLFYNKSLPNEFKMAAFRFGHSMVRENYFINDQAGRVDLKELFKYTGRAQLGGFPKLPYSMVVKWRRFFEPPSTLQKVDAAMQIAPIFNINIPTQPWPGNLMAFLDLQRANVNKLRSVRKCLKIVHDTLVAHFGAKVPSKIKPILYKDVDFQLYAKTKKMFLDGVVNKSKLKRNFPLLPYLLVESIKESTGSFTKLGRLGSYIVADSFYRIMSLQDIDNTEVDSMLGLIKILDDYYG